MDSSARPGALGDKDIEVNAGQTGQDLVVSFHNVKGNRNPAKLESTSTGTATVAIWKARH